MSETNKAALAALEARKKVNTPKVINNMDLPAGSNMYYYCHACNALVKVNPEGWYLDIDLPPKYCDDCQPLVDKGWIS